MVIDSVPSECRPKLNSVVVVPTPGELRSRVRAYSPLKRATPRRQYTCSKLSRHQSKKPANKPENKKENSSQVEEIVQVLSKALVKLHISSTANQTEASNADKSTQTETNLLLEVKAPQRKNNRQCYKCQGPHLRKFRPLKTQNRVDSSPRHHHQMLTTQQYAPCKSRQKSLAELLKQHHPCNLSTDIKFEEMKRQRKVAKEKRTRIGSLH